MDATLTVPTPGRLAVLEQWAGAEAVQDLQRASATAPCGQSTTFSPPPRPTEAVFLPGAGRADQGVDWVFLLDRSGSMSSLTEGWTEISSQRRWDRLLAEVGAAFNASMGGQVVGKLSIDNTR